MPQAQHRHSASNDTQDTSIPDNSFLGRHEEPLREYDDGLAKRRVEHESATLREHTRPIEMPFVGPKSPEPASHQASLAGHVPVTPAHRAKNAEQLPRTLQVRSRAESNVLLSMFLHRRAPDLIMQAVSGSYPWW
jgi:hypothetical protein